MTVSKFEDNQTNFLYVFLGIYHTDIPIGQKSIAFKTFYVDI